MLLSSSLTMFFWWWQRRRWWCLSLCCWVEGAWAESQRTGSISTIWTDIDFFGHFPRAFLWAWWLAFGPDKPGREPQGTTRWTSGKSLAAWSECFCHSCWKIWRMFEASEPRMSGYMHGLKEVPDSRRLTAMKPLKSLNSSWARRFWKLVAPNPNSAQVPLAMVFGQPLECPQKSRGKPVMNENVVQVAPKLF